MYKFTSADTQQSRKDEVVKIDKQLGDFRAPNLETSTTLQSQGHRGVQPNATIFYLTWPGLG